MKIWSQLLLILTVSFISAASARASDPDLDVILAQVRSTPCEHVQVLVADNFGAVRWDRWSMRYLYDAADLQALSVATEESGKRVIRLHESLELPDTSKPDWGVVYDRLVEKLLKTFNDDYANHPPFGC